MSQSHQPFFCPAAHRKNLFRRFIAAPKETVSRYFLCNLITGSTNKQLLYYGFRFPNLSHTFLCKKFFWGGSLGLFYCIILSALLHLYSNLPHLNDPVTFVITSAMFAESSPWPLVRVVSLLFNVYNNCTVYTRQCFSCSCCLGHVYQPSVCIPLPTSDMCTIPGMCANLRYVYLPPICVQSPV